MEHGPSIGVNYGNDDLEKSLEDARVQGFNYVVLPIRSSTYAHDFISTGIRPAAPGEAPIQGHSFILSTEWATLVVGRLTDLRAMDSEDDEVRAKAESDYRSEVAWSTHLSLPSIYFHLYPPPYMSAFRAINQTAQQLHYGQFWAHAPMTYELYKLRLEGGKGDAEGTKAEDSVEEDSLSEENDPWQWWNDLRRVTEHETRIQLVLEVSPNLPDDDVVDRWLSEPVKAVVLHTDIFLTNKSGYPVLSKKHQALVQRLFMLKVQFIVSGPSGYASGHRPYLDYINFLFENRLPMTEQQTFESPYYDFLQAPLQPLMDNLESSTYETFEKDPVKYAQYEEAVYKALMDPSRHERHICLMVVGAGRGPLVKASLQAASRANHTQLKIYAVEKNPNAVVTLNWMKTTLGWGEQVSIISHDMRTWDAPEQADILVSELLGSFGDNELSPECLDGAQRFLKEDGISIPCDYTSHIAPLSCQKVWADVKAYSDLKHFETAFVCKIFNGRELAPSLPCFRFEHPNRPADGKEIDNRRYKKMEFTVKQSDTLHGFIGYFDSTLYGDTIISIHPDTASEGMFSWFPIYFPIRHPFTVHAGEKVVAHFWRCGNGAKVWYEWCVSRPQPSPVHNVNGRSYWIGV